jgi:hypothetical protein
MDVCGAHRSSLVVGVTSGRPCDHGVLLIDKHFACEAISVVLDGRYLPRRVVFVPLRASITLHGVDGPAYVIEGCSIEVLYITGEHGRLMSRVLIS